LQCYVGTHDFFCFAGSLESNQRKQPGRIQTTVRTIHSINLVQKRNESSPPDDDDKSSSYRIDIRLDEALYKMIRNLIGTALEVYRGRIEYNYFVDLIKQPRVLGLTRNNNPSKQNQLHRRD
jgi:tRNA U38,U39,U40 pseudouridine synthase TruA